MSGPRPPAAAAAAAANPSASPSRPLHPTPPPPPAAAARSSVAAARVREEGEVSSGADDEEPLRTHLTTPSNFSKYTEASAQVLSATFPGKGSNSLSLSSVFPLKTVAPSYKKTVRVNQGLYKPGTNRNLTWQKPVSSDNLVITFSDDDSGSDSGKSKQDKSRERKESSQGAHRTGINMNTGIMREEAPQQKTHTVKVGSANWSAVPLALRNSGVGRGSSATFARRDPPVRQVTPQKATYKDGNVVGVSSTVHKLESLRHKIAARENELKVKKPMSPGLVKESGFLTGQKRLPLDKIGFEASDTGACSRPNGLVGHDGRPTKRLKPNQECTNNQAGANMITPVPTGNSLGKNNVQSIESSDHIENGSTMDCDVNETEHAVRTEPVDGRHGDATKNFSSSKMQHRVQFANGQSMVEDASALVPITSIQAGGSVETASIQVKDHVCSTWNEQHVMPASTSTVSNLRAHLQSGIENAEPNSAVQIGIGGQNTSLLSLFEMEEFHERELEDAQEHRRKCEVEEREALRAYRRAQRALIEANERCAILRRRREVFSAQIHSSITENSSLVQPLSIQNAGHGLIIPALLDSQISADFQMLGNQGGRSGTPYPDEPPQHPVDKHESRSRYCDELAASTADPKFMSTVNGNITPSDYMEEDLQFPSTKQARSDCISNLENHVEETIHAYSEENRQTSGESVQDYELLEASLRSRLVERFGKKPYLNNAGEATEELTTGKVFETEHEKLSAYMGLLLHEADENAMTNAEGTMDLANDRHEKIADSSNAPCMGNCDPKDNISSLRELCMPSSMTHPTFPPSAPQNAARHMKCVFSGFPKKASDYKNACLTSNAASEATVCVPDVTQNHAKENAKMHSTTRNDKDIVCSGIDPFWPFCMFELRGKCNDEECQWQHVEHHAWRKSKHTKHAMPSDSGLIPYGLFQHILPVPTYRVGSNLIRADMNLIQSVLASSIWQYWQRGFCASFPLPLSVQRVLPSDAPFLQAGDDSDARFDRNRQLLNFRMLDNRKNKIVQGSVDAELFLEGALVLYFGKVNKPDRLKALLLLARAIEADPSTVILWVFYLHIYYQKDEGLGKDDMFSHAVQHNVYSYELWLMYINSRLRFDDRLDAYNDALSMLCQMTADTEKELKNRSAFVLDIFLQMVYFLCMSGNVEKAISRIYGILPTATPDFSGDKLLADVISCLTASDRCIFWISCLYVSIYRKLPEEITDQLEVPKDLPHALVWSPIEVRVDNRSRHIELLNYAADKISIDINETVKNGDPSYLRLSQFLAVNHISCLAALEGFQSCANVLVKYMKEYPMCPQILLLSARLDGKYGTYSDLKGFDELLQGWPKEVQGIQYLWNQYAEHALADNIELAEKVLTRWFEECGNDSDMQRGAAAGAMEISKEDFVRTSISSTHQVGSGTSISEDQIFWLLNLSLYRMLENNLQEAKVAVDKALKLTHGENYEHCLREHAAIHTLEKLSSYTDIQTQATFSIISGYLLDERNLPMRELLSRRFMQNVKKHRLRQLIDDTIGPASADYSLINSVLEVCYGPSLLPEKMGEVRYLVDFVESVMEVLPANYRLALAVGKFVVKHCAGADSTSMGTRFWASSVLINAIFRAVPVAPESVWLEGANLLEKLQAAETVKRFYQQATSVYPFSFRLWHAYLNTCKASGSNTESIAEAARQRGIELNITPP